MAKSATSKPVPVVPSEAWTQKEDGINLPPFTAKYSSKRSDVTPVKDQYVSNVQHLEGHDELFSIPGLAKVFNRGLPVVTRVFWLFVVCGCTGFCLYQLSDRIEVYLKHQTTLDVSVVRNQTITFPSVTICPSMADNLASLNKGIKARVDEVCQKNDQAPPCRIKETASELRMVNFKFEHLGTSHEELQKESSTMSRDRVNVTIPCDQFADTLCVKELEADYTNITNYWGNCLIVTPRYPMEYRGPYTFIRFDINANGAMLLLHNKGIEQRHDAYFLAEPLNGRKYSTIRVGTKQYHFLNSEKDPCLPEPDYVKCRNKCVDDRLELILNCSIAFMINSKKDPCEFQGEVYSSYMTIQKFYADMKSGDCNCKRKCIETIFSVTTDVVQELPENETQFNLYYPDNMHEIVYESYSYSFPALLSDVGGSLGFYLGFCVVTLVEIVENFFRKTIQCVHKRLK